MWCGYTAVPNVKVRVKIFRSNKSNQM